MEYMSLKRKKMNFKMMVLADCISLEEPIPQQLFDFIEHVAHVSDLRAVVFKDVSSPSRHNNLYNYYHLYRKGQEDLDMDNVLV